jgi:uncharacterized protein (DUF1778 family)
LGDQDWWCRLVAAPSTLTTRHHEGYEERKTGATTTEAQPKGERRRRPERRARLEARITPKLKALLERAAAMEGRSITDFVLTSVQEAALRTIERHEVIHLSVQDTIMFLETLENPPKPNEHPREAARLYRQLIRDSVDG